MSDIKSIFKSKIMWIAALGYFVDLYDLVLYGVVRVQSLHDLHIPESDLLRVGSNLLNYQMVGMLLGGIAWGMIGDRKGRKAALFGSIFLYSTATFMNAFVTTIPQYAALRFLAGFGLAGELGAAVTFVSEALPLNTRGLGSVMVASIGFMGAALSSFVAQYLSWSHAYISGGLLGFCLLVTRISISESKVFSQAREEDGLRWGSLVLLFSSSRAWRVLLCMLVGVPIWYVAGILSFFAPEIAKAYHIQGEVTAGTTVMIGYLGAIVGDIGCGLLSHKLKSRKKAIFTFLSLGGLIAIAHGLWMEGATAKTFYEVRFIIGFGNGYFAVLVAWVAELFGTNLRTTATTLITNLVRASFILFIAGLRHLEPIMGLLNTSIVLGISSFAIALIALTGLTETFHREIKFEER